MKNQQTALLLLECASVVSGNMHVVWGWCAARVFICRGEVAFLISLQISSSINGTLTTEKTKATDLSPRRSFLYVD
uniref:Putative secreted protein n=1 Tax=Ixodes scapularis TaxID=6945 RepID=A0A4D5RDN0_IXOSC